jgi:hypothetical protein
VHIGEGGKDHGLTILGRDLFDGGENTDHVKA